MQYAFKGMVWVVLCRGDWRRWSVVIDGESMCVAPWGGAYVRCGVGIGGENVVWVVLGRGHLMYIQDDKAGQQKQIT